MKALTYRTWNNDGFPFAITTVDGGMVASIWPNGTNRDTEKKVQFIVRACNSHDAMIAALQFVEKYAAMRASKGDPLPGQLVDTVTAALAQATTTTSERT